MLLAPADLPAGACLSQNLPAKSCLRLYIAKSTMWFVWITCFWMVRDAFMRRTPREDTLLVGLVTICT